MKQLIAVMALSALLTGGLAAQIVTNNNYAAGSDFGYEIVLSDTTTLLPIGNVVRYGNFSGSLTDAELQGFLTGGLTPAELATINGAFDPLFSWSVGDGTSAAGSFDVAPAASDGSAFSDERMYMLLYNVNSLGDLDNATEFGLLRNDADNGSDGRFPITGAFPVSSFGYIDAAQMTGLIGGFTSTTFELAPVVIPEPGTWAAMAATVLGLAFWRARRKRS